MSLLAGRLRHRVTIQETVEVQDSDTGDLRTDWADFKEVWASIAPLSAKEFIATAAIQSSVTTRITIRRLNGVTAKMRAVHNGKVYNIQGVLPDIESGLEYLTLPCSEGANNG